jgi:transposase IS4-like protein
VVVYFVMALALFYGDGYEEVMRKLADGLEYMGTWRREWDVPTGGGLCHARQRLGPAVMRELYERVSVPCAMRSTKGAWLAGRRLSAARTRSSPPKSRETGEGEETLARRILSGGAAGAEMSVMADAGLYSYTNFRMVIDAGADALFRVGRMLRFPCWNGSPPTIRLQPDQDRETSRLAGAAGLPTLFSGPRSQH